MNTDQGLDIIMDKAREGKDLADQEVAYLLGLRDEGSVSKLFEAARYVRDRNFGNKVFLYGFVYFSTHCKNNCSFCFYDRLVHLIYEVGAWPDIPSLDLCAVARIFQLPRYPLGPLAIGFVVADEEVRHPVTTSSFMLKTFMKGSLAKSNV